MHFTRNDGSQNMFVYQQTFNVLEIKKNTKILNNTLLVGNQLEYIILDLQH